MVAEKDIEKVREALEGTDYEFSDDRFDNKRRFTESVGHVQGEHEVIANHKQNEFHLGFFLFRREEDKSITIREYFMKEGENGEKVPMVLERNCPKELIDLEYTSQETEFAGTRFRTSTPESVYAKKMFTRHEKDILDIEVLKDKIDQKKINEARKYETTLRVVEAIPERKSVESNLLNSAINTTEEIIKSSTISNQIKNMKELTNEKENRENNTEEQH